jgi:hypothetical protein
MASCRDLKTGEPHWQERLFDENVKVSPVAGDGKVYFLSGRGSCVVAKAGRKFKVLARNELKEDTSPRRPLATANCSSEPERSSTAWPMWPIDGLGGMTVIAERGQSFAATPSLASEPGRQRHVERSELPPPVLSGSVRTREVEVHLDRSGVAVEEPDALDDGGARGG